MFNKFKSRKEEAKYEEMYKGTKDELYEEDLDKVIAGMHMSKEDIENNLRHDDELSIEELDNVKAGIPSSQSDSEYYINEFGEIIRPKK